MTPSTGQCKRDDCKSRPMAFTDAMSRDEAIRQPAIFGLCKRHYWKLMAALMDQVINPPKLPLTTPRVSLAAFVDTTPIFLREVAE
jgi:hypothetical protein